LVEQRGGQAQCLDNDKALKELADWENKSNTSQGTSTGPGSKTTKPSNLDDLKGDLHTDPDTAMEQNMTKFERKFEVQTRQIMLVTSCILTASLMGDSDEMSRVVERQGDRIISAVTAGPHDKIIDPVSARANLGVIMVLIFLRQERPHYMERDGGKTRFSFSSF
jgi:hypothetical protein